MSSTIPASPAISLHPRARAAAWALVGLSALLVSACGTKPTRTVSVEDRAIQKTSSAPSASRPSGAAASPAAIPSPVDAGGPVSNAGKPGYYTVRPGDTLVRIGLDNGQNWRDIARWNQIENPNMIEVGQVLRVSPEPGVVREARPRPDARPSTPGRDTLRDTPRDTARDAARDTPRDTSRDTPRDTPRETPLEPAREPVGEVAWAWPAAGAVVQGFDEQRNKGVDISGKAGDPVYAAADGKVVYAGSALRGYGNLVILKHNATYLSAYAHNQTLLVKEEQVVKRGQKIAEMGNSDAERVQLHFEIRRDGKPIDPARLLPTR